MNASNFLRKISDSISAGLESYFQWHGRIVSDHPWMTIACSSVAIGLCCLGVLMFERETNMVKLWIPEESDFARNNEWLWANHPPDVRFNNMILVDKKNVLRPAVIQTMYAIHKRVLGLRTEDGLRWDDLCIRLPVLNVGKMIDLKRKKRNDDFIFKSGLEDSLEDFEEEEEDAFFRSIESGVGEGGLGDPSVLFYPDGYCPIVEAMPTTCFETSILEMFAVDGEYSEETDRMVENLTQEELLFRINNVNMSGIFLRESDFTSYLGGIERDAATGKIVGAKATSMRWFGKANVTAIKVMMSKRGEDLGMHQQPVDVPTLDFEKLLEETLNDKSQYPDGLESSANIQRSYGDVSSGAILDDVTFLIVGYVLIYVYVQVMLGKFNRVEQRAFLGAIGILSCGLSALVSIGLCSAFGLAYGPMHPIIPCLLVGLGVDDMFVIVQAFNNVESLKKGGPDARQSVSERVGLAMKHAGVGVTVTSVTDIIVFGIGATTILPSLRSYSLYTMVGIASTFVLQITLFVACLALDQRRIEARRDGTICCYKHSKDWKPNKCSQRQIAQDVFSWLGVSLMKPISKVLVLLITIVVLGLGTWGCSQLQVKFQYLEFLPTTSDLYQWFKLKENFFPEKGEYGSVHLALDDLVQELPKIKHLGEQLEAQNDSIAEVTSWFPGFEEYFEENFLPSGAQSLIGGTAIPKSLIEEKLTQYLFSPKGAKYMNMFTFEEKIECGEKLPKALITTIDFYHRLFSSPKEYIPAMNRVKQLIQGENFSGTAFAMSQAYSRWEIDEIIFRELLRNLLLALVCVFFTTLVLLADLGSCLSVMGCVILTLVDVCGAMHAWGLTVDIVASTNLIIAVGLCVDFSVHIAHTFMLQNGTKNKRAGATLRSIGPAVFHGGMSTLVAVLMLVNSKSHVFVSYFKIFFLMIAIGLFHGLMFLPVLLSLVGPRPYPHVLKLACPEDNQERLSVTRVEEQRLQQMSLDDIEEDRDEAKTEGKV